MRTAPIAALALCAVSTGALAQFSWTDPYAKVPDGESSGAGLLISEILGSTSSSDWEFIELCNAGDIPVTLLGWSIELWDSDAGSSYGGADGGAPYVINVDFVLAPGETYTLGNDLAQAGYGGAPYGFDGSLPANAVENSSYTAILADPAGNLIDGVFVTDGGADDSANRAGTAISPSMTVGPDGSNLPAGFARTDIFGGHVLLNFDTGDLGDGTVEGGTPGINQIPAPASAVLLALAAAAAPARRRR